MKLLAIALLALALGGCVVVGHEPAPAGKGGGGSVLVCHKGKQTLELPQSAADAHIGHGDRYGPC